MARNPSRNANEISRPEDSGVPIRFNEPDILKLIKEAEQDIDREQQGDRAKFEVAFNDADRLYHVKVEREFGTEQFEAFARQCGRAHSEAYDLLKLHGQLEDGTSYRDDGMKWFDATVHWAELEGNKRPNVSWQAYARYRKLIRKTSRTKAGAENDGDAKPASRQSKQPQSIDAAQRQITKITKERDKLKVQVETLQRERDDALAELKRLKAAQNESGEAAAGA